ncbi:hypothetical protein ATCC53582_02312 [Novacetimonas hansenii]|nr:hypothetical protein ATCC53582_02312 [Novacetimonas hansenii]
MAACFSPLPRDVCPCRRDMHAYNQNKSRNLPERRVIQTIPSTGYSQMKRGNIVQTS